MIQGFESSAGARRVSRDIVNRAHFLLSQGYAEDADFLLTTELLDRSGDPELWMAAGIARLSRRQYRSAASAFTMCAWLGGEQNARLLADYASRRR